MKWRDDLLRPQANNFTLVRLVLASSVIYTHSYEAVLGMGGGDAFTGLLGAPISVYAVDGFFFLSGFLVYPSLLRLGSIRRFLIARFTRLWPGLALAVGLTVLGGAFVTAADGLSYLGGDTTTFILGNLSFVKGAYTLTGVNCGDQPCNINGSLWTLPWEARCYAVLALCAAVGLAKPRLMLMLVLPLTYLCSVVWHFEVVQDWADATLSEGLLHYIDVADRLWTLFALGVGAYIVRHRLPLSWLIAAALFGLNLLSMAIDVEIHARALFIGYGVLCLGLLSAEKRSISGKWPDYSYGMYIYAFPVMVALHALMGQPTYVTLALATFACTLPFAMISWHFVEKPALDLLKRHRAAKTASAAAT
jgi:peptidoglycan/LPS O-acetylase OafA/YrhL